LSKQKARNELGLIIANSRKMSNKMKAVRNLVGRDPDRRTGGRDYTYSIPHLLGGTGRAPVWAELIELLRLTELAAMKNLYTTGLENRFGVWVKADASASTSPASRQIRV
jgi:hypothetical protein